MKPIYHKKNKVALFCGNSLKVLRKLKSNSVDAIVTDPPYGLNSKEPDMNVVLAHWLSDKDYETGGKGFMGADWDRFVPGPAIWKECLRVLKPGGHLLSFFGSRTYDMGTLAIRLAGFEIRDQIMWVYGSGFPKSLNVSKAIDKANGRELEDCYRLGRHIRSRRQSKGLTIKQVNEKFRSTSLCNHWEAQDPGNALAPTPKHWAYLKKWLGCASEYDDIVNREGAVREVTGAKKNAMSGWNTDGTTKFADRNITVAFTDAARQWEGWGTALKPAHEPICVARKPLAKERTVASNVLTHGTGALNIDGCRVATSDTYSYPNGRGGSAIHEGGQKVTATAESNALGRWPANLIHDGSDGVLALFPEAKGAVSNSSRGNGLQGTSTFAIRDRQQTPGRGDTGSAARFFYCAKTSKADRETGNNHPTVKPTNLMAYLIRLVTPKGGLVLDPFMGSGSTGKAAMRENMRFIGVDLSSEFAKIAQARISKSLSGPKTKPLIKGKRK